MNPNKPSRLAKIVCLLIPNFVLFRIFHQFSFFKFVKETANTQTPISIQTWYNQKILNINHGPHWPVHKTSTVDGWRNITCGVETSPGYSPGNYISAYYGKITIGDYTQIAPNVGLISSNHDVYDNSVHVSGSIVIGAYCWIGMGAVILPNVVLGDFTVVGAGSVVTKSFPDGYCVIGGNPARIIKKLEPEKCVRKKSMHEYNGYIPNSDYEEFRKRNLN